MESNNQIEMATEELCSNKDELKNSWRSRGSSSLDSLYRSRSLMHFSLDSFMEQSNESQETLLESSSTDTDESVTLYLTSDQKKTLFLLVLVDFMCFCSASIMAPFFPREAAEKGLSNTQTGLVFGFYAFIMFITSPLFGKILPVLGVKFLFVSGIFLAGGCNILFGVLEYVEEYMMFSTFCFLIRGFEALGASAFSTASYVFAVHTFPDNIGAVLGILETFVGLGMSVGPAVGGLLYSVGGFKLPFYVLGTAMLLIVPLNIFMLPTVTGLMVGSGGRSIFKLLKVPAVIITSLVIIIVSSLWGFLDPTLEPHLREFNLTPEQIGMIFLLFSALYGISSPFWGFLTDKLNHHWLMMVWGLLLSTVALLLLGPCPYIPFLENTLWLNLVSLSALGISVALVLLPTFQSLLNSAIDGGFDDSLITHSLVAGVWSCMYSFGEVVGPSIGGFLLQHYDFPICATVMAGSTFIMAVVLGIFFCIKSQTSGTRECPSESESNESWRSEPMENTPLLNSKMGLSHKCYMKEKVSNYEQSRKIDEQRGELDRNQVTDIRGTMSVTGKGACEA